MFISLKTTIVLTTLLQAAAPAPRPASPSAHQSTQRRASDALAVQVMLDRAGFSPGAIDGRAGRNTDKALTLYKANGGDANAIPADAVTQYTISEQDAAGPYEPNLPNDMMELAKLPAVAYRTALEALSERFHSTPALIQRLNPAATFAAGETITVPNVSPMIAPVERPKPDPKHSAAERGAVAAASGSPPGQPSEIMARPDVVVSVSKAMSALTVADATGRVVFSAPVTTGSDRDPLPIGEWKVNGVQFNPTFRYNPALFWDADPAHSKATVPAGPNSPVGLVWIDLSKDHYGIHGTPEPATVGRTESHGCVRLTNWDALRLAGLVKPGTRVVFAE